jgi:hypothetical protein
MYVVDSDALRVAVVEALRSHAGEVLSIDVFREEALDVASVARDVLALQLMSGSAEPCDSVLNVLIIRHLFGCVHSY